MTIDGKKLTESLPHVLVEVNGVRVFHELPDHLTLVVLHHQHLLWFGHAAHHQQTYLQAEEEKEEEASVIWSKLVLQLQYTYPWNEYKIPTSIIHNWFTFVQLISLYISDLWLCVGWHAYLGQHGQVEVSSWRDIGQERGAGCGEGTLPVQLGCQVVPILQTDLEDLSLLNLRHQQHEVQGLETKCRGVTLWYLWTICVGLWPQAQPLVASQDIYPCTCYSLYLVFNESNNGQESFIS